MPRARQATPRCQCCLHAERWRIELGLAAGASLDALSEKYKVHRQSIWRHWKNHVSPETKSRYLCGSTNLEELAEKAAESGTSVIENFEVLRRTLMSSLAAMAEAGDARGSAYVGRALGEVLEKLAKVTGELGTMATTINIGAHNTVVLANDPTFLRMQAAMLRALSPFPDARAAVVSALRDLDGPPTKMIEHVPAAA